MPGSWLPPPPTARRSLTDRGAVALAGAVGLGAWWARPLPLAVGAALAVVAVVLRRPSVLVVAGLVLASALGARALAGLQPPEPGPFEGTVTLVADPRPNDWGTSVDVRLGDRRVELRAGGGAAGTVGRALAGEQLTVRGSLRPPPADAPWLVPRHVSGRLTVTEAEAHHAGAMPWRAANRFRRLLARGAASMDEPARQLYGGFVLGDQSGQSVEVVDDFRAAGLTHLLVVSGSNVAYLLVLLTPLRGRLPLGARWLVTVGVIGSFALVTRFEPSVLRASAMAALAVSTSLAGRPTAPLRVLALAVTALVLVDPLLVRSVGFQLSVAATLGIVVGSGPIARALRGPEVVRQALAVTLSAQLAVAPLLAPRFGGVPVVAVPANLVAAPAAGLVTMWGLPAGVAAGALGSPAAGWLHRPTELGIGWVAGTARVAAGLPLGELDLTAVALTAGLGGVLLTARRRGWPGAVRVGAAVGASLVVLAPAVALRHPAAVTRPGPGLQLHRGGGATVLVVDGGAGPADALEGLRRVGVRRLDVVVLPEADPALVGALRHRWTIRRVVVLDDLDAPVALVVGGLEVRVELVEPGGPGGRRPVADAGAGARTRSARARVGSAG
ncbi:MAG: ComEC/Rec2 family competence protein [Acidimicrobiales bacterium]|nr:ComEC/Rec2 family competence protein [Acidimicrobiales bacterium]